MKPADVEALCNLVGHCSYNAENKERWRKLSRKLLKSVVEILALPKGSYDLRYNPAGIACGGDATLHHDKVYVQFTPDMICNWILVRTCEGRKDYAGGWNRSYSFDDLRRNGVGGLAEFVGKVMQ